MAAVDAPQELTQWNPNAGGTLRVGTEDHLWSGGSYIRAGTRRSVMCFRPATIREAIKTEEKCIEGLPKERRIDITTENKVPLATWLREVKRYMEQHGLDAVFKIPEQRAEPIAGVAAAGGNPGVHQVRGIATEADGNTEHNILVAWGTADETVVTEWEEYLQTYGDECDRRNLLWSGQALLSSIGPVLWDSVERQLPGDVATGPTVFVTIINLLQATNVGTVRKMVEELGAYQLEKEPGENVRTFSEKVTNTARKIIGTGHDVPDLSLVVARCYSSGTVQKFSLFADGIYNELDDNVEAYRWDQVVSMMNKKYKRLDDAGLWTAKKTKKADAVAGLKAEVKTLTAKLDRVEKGNNNGTQGDSKKKPIKCFGCGEEGHIKRNCPNKDKWNQNNNSNDNEDKQKDPWKQPPKKDEPREKEINGKQARWCGRCSRWTSGDKIHYTEDHIVGAGRHNNDDADDKPKEEGARYAGHEHHLVGFGMLCQETNSSKVNAGSR